MDNDLKMVEGQRRRFPLTGVSLLVLTLLLTAVVASLIYLSINNQHVCRQLKEREEKTDIEANINIKSDDREREENIKYNENSRVAYYYGSGGSEGIFEVDDFSKGIHIFRNPADRVCYVVPVGASSHADHSFEKFLSKENGRQIHTNATYKIEYEILPGEIEDLSMIPQGAHKECTNGYKWMIITKKMKRGDGLRMRRQVQTKCDYCFFVRNPVTEVTIAQCFQLSYTANVALPECPHLYRKTDVQQLLGERISRDEIGKNSNTR